MLRIAFLLLLLPWPLAAQGSAADQQADPDALELGHVHVDWPAPETLLKDLRSANYETRLKALSLVGMPYTTDTLDELELRYGSLDNDSQEAILGAVKGPYVYGAVAIHSTGGWKRIANFSCWCKYENGDLLARFMRVEDGPNGSSELVVRASGGGTGLYDQSEFHFRVHEGELRTVLSFKRRFRECPWSPSGNGVCDGAHRWFYPQEWGQVQGGVLAETKFRFNVPEHQTLEPEYSIPELERLHAQTPICTKYVWDEKAFRYTQSSTAQACREIEVEP